MAKIVWTQEAEQWLLKIHDYIAQDKPATTLKVVKSIYARAQILEHLTDTANGHETTMTGDGAVSPLEAWQRSPHTLGIPGRGDRLTMNLTRFPQKRTGALAG